MNQHDVHGQQWSNHAKGDTGQANQDRADKHRELQKKSRESKGK